MNGLNEMERARLAQLADLLIPKAEGALSASEAGIAGKLLDEIEKHAPERIVLLRRVIQRQGTPAEALLTFLPEDRAAYDGFCETIVAAYFMAPEVRRKVGFPGREPVPARTDVSDIEELLLPVLEAGFAPRHA
jgi:hypothetical protein